jgi:cation diffusion facilitator family transporter
MTPQRRTALVSVVAAGVLMGIKLVTGLASGSLGLVSEALHSGTDLVAALLTLFAVGVAGRPADRSHPYGHGKAEHLAALGEAAVLALVSVAVAVLASARLAGWVELDVETAWWVFAAVALVLAIDLSRMLVSARSARRYASAAFASNALHFGSDLAGTLAVLAGLLAVRAGWPAGDSIAALFVALLVVTAAARLMRRNVDVLMDRAPADWVTAASRAVERLEPPVALTRLRLRQAGGRAFVDVVIGVPPEAAVGQGHAFADRVEAVVHRALPESDVVVHVEPAGGDPGLRERIRVAAMAVPHVREIHDLAVIELERGTVDVSLHLKLPGELALEEAHAVAEQVERAVASGVPEVVRVQTHLEPLDEQQSGREIDLRPNGVELLVRRETGRDPRELRFLRTDEGIVLYVTLAVGDEETLSGAHETATRVETCIREGFPDVADVIVHTEP